MPLLPYACAKVIAMFHLLLVGFILFCASFTSGVAFAQRTFCVIEEGLKIVSITN